MALTTIGQIADKAETILQDTTNTRWPLAELVGWINDAYKEIVLARPDANTLTATVTLAAGTRQKLGDTGSINLPTALRVIDVVRNMATTSSKRSVRLINRSILDDQIPDWHATAQNVNIQHWMYDDRVPKEFLVYPPATALAQLEIAYALVPTAHAIDTPVPADVIKLDDIYANAILDYVLYRAYSKDADYAGNAQRMSGHYQAFASAIGLKTQVDGAISPNSKASADVT